MQQQLFFYSVLSAILRISAGAPLVTNDCERLLGGLENLGWSIDLRYFDPFRLSSPENGLRQSVLDLKCRRMSIKGLQNGTEFDVPEENFSLTMLESNSSSHFQIRDSSEYRLLLEDHFEAEDTQLGSSAYASTYKQIQHLYWNNSITILGFGRKEILYEAGLYEPSIIFTTDLYRDLNSLPVDFNPDTVSDFERFLSRYGTHLIVGIVGGGVSWKLDEVRLTSDHEDLYLSEKSQEIRGQLAQIFFSGQSNAVNQQCNYIRLGGQKNAKNDLDWIQSVREEPAAVSLILRPFYIYVNGQERAFSLMEATESFMIKAELNALYKCLENVTRKLKEREPLYIKVQEHLDTVQRLSKILTYDEKNVEDIEVIRADVIAIAAGRW